MEKVHAAVSQAGGTIQDLDPHMVQYYAAEVNKCTTQEEYDNLVESFIDDVEEMVDFQEDDDDLENRQAAVNASRAELE